MTGFLGIYPQNNYGVTKVMWLVTFDDISIHQVMTDRFCVAAAQATQCGGGGTQLSQTTKDATKALQDLGRKQEQYILYIYKILVVCLYIYIYKIYTYIYIYRDTTFIGIIN